MIWRRRSECGRSCATRLIVPPPRLRAGSKILPAAPRRDNATKVETDPGYPATAERAARGRRESIHISIRSAVGPTMKSA
jgi:hypothetical protein